MGGDSYGYNYDSIGNRVWSAENAATNLYAANALNQYTAVSNQQSAVGAPAYYDADGNLTYCTLPDGVWVFSWDGENRLAAAERLTFDASGYRIRVRNVYDHGSRRVAKQLQRRYYREDGGMLLDEIRWGFPAASARRVWDGWNIVAETAADAVAGTTNVHFYTWGLDLSGTLQGAGGVGGLLAVLRNGTPYFPCYDANGNVTGYVATNGASVARYEYSPFGETTAKTGSMADDFAHRFSTKPFDAETGLVMYQRRPHSPPLGRFLSRDPIEETGGVNLYGYLSNNPINKWDFLGLRTISVPRCQGYLILGHTSQSDPIKWKFPDGCAYGGVVGCWPGQNNPTNQLNRWPNVPTHNEKMFEGFFKRFFSATSLQYVDFATDYIGGEEQETDFTKAVENALSQTSFNNIVDNLCGTSCCCDEIVLKIHVTKGGWEIKNSVEPYSLKPGITVTVKGKCPARKK